MENCPPTLSGWAKENLGATEKNPQMWGKTGGAVALMGLSWFNGASLEKSTAS